MHVFPDCLHFFFPAAAWPSVLHLLSPLPSREASVPWFACRLLEKKPCTLDPVQGPFPALVQQNCALLPPISVHDHLACTFWGRAEPPRWCRAVCPPGHFCHQCPSAFQPSFVGAQHHTRQSPTQPACAPSEPTTVYPSGQRADEPGRDPKGRAPAPTRENRPHTAPTQARRRAAHPSNNGTIRGRRQTAPHDGAGEPAEGEVGEL